MTSDVKLMLQYENIWRATYLGVTEGETTAQRIILWPNERWVYHSEAGTADKSPDARVLRVGISLVPVHYTHQWAFLQMSEWKISQLITVCLRADQQRDHNLKWRRSRQAALLNCLISGPKAVVIAHAHVAYGRLLTAIPYLSVFFSLALPSHLSVRKHARLFYNSPSCWINPCWVANLWASVTLCSLQ